MQAGNMSEELQEQVRRLALRDLVLKYGTDLEGKKGKSVELIVDPNSAGGPCILAVYAEVVPEGVKLRIEVVEQDA